MAFLLMCGASVAAAQSPGTTGARCDSAALAGITNVEVPGSPFEALATNDGCTIFVSLARLPRRSEAGIAVLRRDGGRFTVSHVIGLGQSPRGMTLTHDGALLVAAAGSALVFLDVVRAIAGDDHAVLARLESSRELSRIMVSVTRDDRWLFASNEYDSSVTVMDLAALRRSGFAQPPLEGTVRVDIAPITVELSPDERYLYTTSERARESAGWPTVCKPEVGQTRRNGPHAVGTISVIDVARATSGDPQNAVVARVAASCSPVRLVLSPDGAVAYVTARNSDALLAFDTGRLLTDPEHALLDSVAVGTAPVGLALVDSAHTIVVANSNRFGRGDRDEDLTVVDATTLARGGMRVVGRIPAGRFPRELHLTGDGRLLVVTNFNSRTVELVPLPLPVSGSGN